jgi:UPF0271 protein
VRTIDLNADVGEGSEDAALYPLLSSVNVACGGHAGDEASMAKAIVHAAMNGVAIGAHPSYPDRSGFGRVSIAITPRQIAEAVADQVAALTEVAEQRGVRLTHVKPHGALYNDAARDTVIAAAIADGVARVTRDVALVALAGSTAHELWRDLGWRVIAEGFCDRAYEADGRLTPRSEARALLVAPDEAARQAVHLAAAGRCRTLCVHSDTPGAAAILAAVRAALEAAGFAIAAV